MLFIPHPKCIHLIQYEYFDTTQTLELFCLKIVLPEISVRFFYPLKGIIVCAFVN